MKKTNNYKTLKLSKIVFLLVLFTFMLYCSAFSGNIRYTKGGYIAAITEDLLDKAIRLSVAGDDIALQKLLNSNLVIVLKKGIKVEVIDTKFFSGKAKIRPFGTNIELWTVIEAILTK